MVREKNLMMQKKKVTLARARALRKQKENGIQSTRGEMRHTDT